MWNPAREGIDFMMTAGPVEVSPRVLTAMALPSVYHYYPKFIDVFDSTTEKLSKVFRTKKENIVLLQGEAVLGLEASIACTINRGEKVLIFENGPFGKWFGKYVDAAGGVPVYLHEESDRGFDVDTARAFIEENSDAVAMTIAHCETPAGLLNQVEPICRKAKDSGMLTIVDGVASIAGVEFRPTEWGIDIAITASQKCLGAPAGLAPMAISPFAWERIERKSIRNSYLSLLDWKDSWLTSRRFPYTPFTNNVYGLSAALDEILEEGLENCISRHADAALYCREGLKRLGLQLWPVREEDCSPTVTTLHVPPGKTDSQIIDSVVSKYRILIGGGYGETKGKLLRIGTMGYEARRHFVSATLDAIENVMRS